MFANRSAVLAPLHKHKVLVLISCDLSLLIVHLLTCENNRDFIFQATITKLVQYVLGIKWARSDILH